MRGRMRNERYQPREWIGSGGVRKVRRAGDTRREREVAAEVLTPRRGATEDARRAVAARLPVADVTAPPGPHGPVHREDPQQVPWTDRFDSAVRRRAKTPEP